VANTLWAYATMGRAPGAGLLKVLEGRAEAVAGTFKAQNVANTLWAACLFSIFLRPSGKKSMGAYGCAATLDKPGCLNTAQLCQLHQFFVWCGVEPRLGEEAINDMQSLKEACQSAFEGTKPAQSATQQEVSKTLRQLGLSVEDEARCPKSGYSIDMLVHVHDSSLGWAVEVDGPSHFLESGAPTGATLLKRRYLLLLGHTLVSVPYWEWERCQGAGEREQYLSSKLDGCRPFKFPKIEPLDHTSV
jgi:hypothetical protein